MGKSSKIFNRKPTLRSLAKRVDRIEDETEVKFAFNWNYSYNQLIASLTFADTNPVLHCINALEEGTGHRQRIGDHVQGTSIRCTGKVYWPGGGLTLGLNGRVRILIICDKDPNGTAPVLYGDTASPGFKVPIFRVQSGFYPTVQHMYNVEDGMYEQYDILYDHIYPLITQVGSLDGAGNPSSVNPEMLFDINVPFRRKVSYEMDGLSPTIQEISKNSLHIAFICDMNVELAIELDSRFMFKDL